AVGRSRRRAYVRRARSRAMAEQAELTRPETRHKIETVNPATGAPGKSYEETSLAEARDAAAAARKSVLDWRRTSCGERSAISRAADGLLRARKDEFARLMTD